MIEPTTVWAARLGSPDEGIKGYLVLETEHLSFTSELGDIEIRIPLAEVRRARRIFGSPVMVIEHDRSVVAFYFAQPPPLVRSRKHLLNRRERSNTLAYLGDTNTTRREDIKRWVKEIKRAARAARD